MSALESGNWNALGDWDAHEPPFTRTELREAAQLRQRVIPNPSLRHDRCPHETPCESIRQCVQFIAWYRRHQALVEMR